jgi:hypothetical protein
VTADDDAAMDKNNDSEQRPAPLRPRERTRQRWHTLIEEQSASGLTVTEFCRRRSVSPGSFYRWRGKLSAAAPVTSGFVAVRLAGRRGRVARVGRGHSPLEVRLRGGRRVLVRDFFRRDLLIELVGVLEGLA